VGAGKGFYEMGYLFCSDPVEYVKPESEYGYTTTTCLHQYNLQTGESWESAHALHSHLREQDDIARAVFQEEYRLALVNGGVETLAVEANVRSLEAVVVKVLGSAMALSEMTFSEIASVRNELDRRIQAKKMKGIRQEWEREDKCPRCGGAGRADKWAFTGHVCFRCGGSGKY
jgi:DnaJ-class molecular chaperone